MTIPYTFCAPYLQPLSATLVKSTHWTSTKGGIEDDTISTAPGLHNPSRSQSSTAADPRPFSSFPVPSSWRRGQNSSSQPRHSSFFDEELRPIEMPEALEVSVMIVMPSQERSKSGPSHDHGETGSGEEHDATHSHPEPRSGSTLPEYQIGTMSVPWHTELRRETGPTWFS